MTIRVCKSLIITYVNWLMMLRAMCVPNHHNQADMIEQRQGCRRLFIPRHAWCGAVASRLIIVTTPMDLIQQWSITEE